VDHLYGRLHYANAQTAEPVFRITDPATIIRAVTGAKKRAEWQWYYSWERDFTFEGILAAYGAVPPNQPNTERIEHSSMTPSTTPPADSGSGTPMGAAAPPPSGPPGLPIMGAPAAGSGAITSGAADGTGGSGPAPRPAQLPLNREAQLARVTSSFHQVPQWARLLAEAYPRLVSTMPADRQDAEAMVRQASAMVTSYDVFQDLAQAVYADRPSGVQCLRNLANWGAELASQVGNVSATTFRTQAIALGNVSGALQHCPAITRAEFQETGTGNARYEVFADADLQNALKCGLSHLEFLVTPRNERRSRVEAIAAAMRASYEAELAELRANEEAEASGRAAPPETNTPAAPADGAVLPASTANFGGAGSSPGGPSPTATQPAHAPPLMTTPSTGPAQQEPSSQAVPQLEAPPPESGAAAAQLAAAAAASPPGAAATQPRDQEPQPAQEGEVVVEDITHTEPLTQHLPLGAGLSTRRVVVTEGEGATSATGSRTQLGMPPFSRASTHAPPPPPPPGTPSAGTRRYMAPTASARARAGTQQPTTTLAPLTAAGPLGSTQAAGATSSATAPAAPASSPATPLAMSSATAAAAGSAATTSVTTTAVDFEVPRT
jgi:hypothetical protein